MLRLIIVLAFFILRLQIIAAQDSLSTPLEASNNLVSPFYTDENYQNKLIACPNEEYQAIDCFQQGVFDIVISPTDPNTFFLYFQENRDENGRYIGFGQAKHFNFDESVLSIVFSNNGKYIAIIKEESNPNSSISDKTIHVGSVDGKEPLTAITSQDYAKYSTKDVDQNRFLPVKVIWSPNDEQIMFTAGLRDKNQPEEYYAGSEVFIMDRNGTNIKPLPSIESPLLWAEFGIIFTSSEGAEYGSNRLYCVQPDGSDLIKLSESFVPYEVSLSPNGKYVAFSEWSKPASFKVIDLSTGKYILNINMNEFENMFVFELTDSDFVKSFTWSEDSTQIAFMLSKFANPPKADGNAVISYNLKSSEYTLVSNFAPIHNIYWDKVDGLIAIHIDTYHIYRLLKLD